MTARCHEEVPDATGWASPCDRPATTTRTDEDGDEYPVCSAHADPKES